MPAGDAFALCGGEALRARSSDADADRAGEAFATLAAGMEFSLAVFEDAAVIGATSIALAGIRACVGTLRASSS